MRRHFSIERASDYSPYPEFSHSSFLETDAYGDGLGAVLAHEQPDWMIHQ